MIQQDLQFIERALKHPWLFWVYFWKWPRIVRQACAEYDMLAKERDAAQVELAKANRANEKVRKWIHVTHRLSTTPEGIREMFAAGKRLSILLVFFVVTNTYGQAPPYLRNQWTTNANPLALKVISTNGVRAATNVWELDFTNTATVTVSAVSNANKVMVSFTGSASSGSSSLTNALLHAGPTNGSVDALILAAGNGVTLTTSGTNRIAAIDTNVVAEISDLLWTNVTVPASGIGGVGDVLTSLNPYQTVQITTNFLNFWGDGSMSMLIGYGVGDLTIIATNNIGIVGIGDYAFQNNRYTNCQSITGLGLYSFANSQMTGCDAITGMGDLCFQGVNMIETTDVLGIGGAFAIATFQESSLILGAGTFVGRSAIFTNCDNFVSVGQESLENGRFTNCNAITSFGYRSLKTAKLTDCNFLTFLGPNSGTNLVLSGVSNAIVVGNIRSAIPLTDEFWFGNTNNVYRMPGNIATIRGVSGYSWPTAHAAGVLTNNGSGNLGWLSLSTFNSQTPWLSDINADRFSLTNFDKLISKATNGIAGFTIGDVSDMEILKIDPLDIHTNASSFMAFSLGVHNANFTGQSNQVLNIWGYNSTGAGARLNTNESAFLDTFESSWDPGADGVNRQHEKYITYTSPAGELIRLDAGFHRWNIATGTNVFTQRDFNYQQVNFNGLTNNLAWMTFTGGENNGDYGSVVLDGKIFTQSNIVNRGGVDFRHGGAAAFYNQFQSKNAQIYYPTGSGTNYFTIADVTSGQTNRFQDWRETEFRTDFANTRIAVKAGTAQTDNLQEWRNNSGTAIAQVSSNGGFFTGAGAHIGGLAEVGKSNLVVEGNLTFGTTTGGPTTAGIASLGANDLSFYTSGVGGRAAAFSGNDLYLLGASPALYLINDTSPQVAFGANSEAILARSAVGTLKVTTNLVVQGYHTWSGESYASIDLTNQTTSLSNLTLSVTVVSGIKYAFKCILFANDSVAADGAVISFDAGTAGETNFRAQITAFDAALALSQQNDDLTDTAAIATFTGNGSIEVHGSFEPSSTGTFGPRFAQNAHTTGVLTIYRGSHLIVWQMP